MIDRFFLNSDSSLTLLDRLAPSESDRVERIYKIDSVSSSTKLPHYNREGEIGDWRIDPLDFPVRPKNQPNRHPKITSKQAQQMRNGSIYLRKLLRFKQQNVGQFVAYERRRYLLRLSRACSPESSCDTRARHALRGLVPMRPAQRGALASVML